jgi:hypothetical protein
MTQTFKLHIDAVSPDGIAVNCQSEINIQAERHTSVSILANLFNQEPKIKELVAEALLLSLSDEKIAEQIDADDFLDSMLKAKNKN